MAKIAFKLPLGDARVRATAAPVGKPAQSPAIAVTDCLAIAL